MNPKHFLSTIPTFLVGCLLALSFHIYFTSPISPDLLNLPPPSSASVPPTNNHLKKITKLGEGFLEGPEDVCVDNEGILYAATRDGWIKRLYNNNSVEDWKMTNRNHLLGITATASGDLVVCDSEEGLLKVSEDGVTSIVSYFNNSKIRFADDVVEARDGTLYFSIASTKFGLHNWFLDMLEAKPHGQLLKHDPSTNHTTLVMDNLCFANGVALSADQDYLLVCETWKFRILKYWLEGDRKGQTETFIENLPGGPDNINLAPDGTFWVALIQLTSSGFEFVHTSKIAKHLIATFSALSNLVLGAHQSAMVVNVAADGRILRILGDTDGRVTSFVTSAVEFEDHLYLGSLSSNFVGKLPL
ncbi:hypothetical protein Nepgr_018426 [Nepenthes gracilis]|uniref:Strictosidine synthase conserved region domain-containing protein n=1 Tax=Nepenthes gracilis TaxID=150966 RepID=A0AAD3STA3_NEPGR|nr:hypothetical protein Nepgr_018426 [Nepenthes gracilis]